MGNIAAFSDRLANADGSAVQEILRLTQQPDIISFAGGLPSADAFPIEDMQQIMRDFADHLGAEALQYGAAEGYKPLREEIIRFLKAKNIHANLDEIIITSGSQQGLDLVAKTFLNKGDKVIVESPTYLAALQAFSMYEPEFIEAPVDADGVIPAKLDEILAGDDKVKLIYLIPCFQNPSGRTIPAARRKEILEVVKKYDVVLIEDAPYEDLKYTDEEYPSFKSMDETGQVLYFGSFSKSLAPGFRLGYSVGCPKMLERMVIGKQNCDLNVSVFTQMIVAEYMRRDLLPPHIKKICKQYRAKRDLMLDALEKEMPEGVKWTKPEGGLFIWIELPDYMDTDKMFIEAVEKKVAYVAGSSFFAKGEPRNCMRVNFSNATPEKVVQGVKALAEVVKANLK